MRISIIVPIYKEPELLEDIISKLMSNSYKDFEILVVIDGSTNSDIEEVISKFRDKINVIYNNRRLGKVTSLNKATKVATGDAFLFFDNDIELPNDTNFLLNLVKELENNDIVEMPKEGIVKNFFSKVVSYDYLGGAIASWLSSKILGKNLFLCGSAFAIRKESFHELGGFSKVVNEDWDLMLKAFNLKKKFSFPTHLKVKTSLPRNFREWIDQRKRWSLGVKFWWIEIIKYLKSYLKTLPVLSLIGIFLSAPTIIGVIIWKFDIFSKFLSSILLVLQHLGINPGIFVGSYIISIGINLFSGFSSFVISIILNILLFFTFSRIFRFRFNLIEFLIYSLIYYPFMIMFYIIYGFIISSITKVKFDWAIEDN